MRVLNASILQRKAQNRNLFSGPSSLKTRVLAYRFRKQDKHSAKTLPDNPYPLN